MDLVGLTRAAIKDHVEGLPGNWIIYFDVDLHSPALSSVGLPAFPNELSGREYDAIAVDETGNGIVYEVVVQRRAGLPEAKMRHIASLRSAVRTIPGWRFELIVLAPDNRDLEDERVILENLNDARRIVDLAPAASFLSAFSALEWKLANWVKRLGLKYSANVVGLASELITAAYIDDSFLPAARRFQEIRNSLVHGYRVSNPVTVDVVDELFDFIDEIDRRISEQVQG